MLAKASRAARTAVGCGLRVGGTRVTRILSNGRLDTSFGCPPQPVAAKPGVPRTVVVTRIQSGSLGIGWSAPASDGGSALTGYTVTWAIAHGTAKSATVTGPSATISGLTRGALYTITVAARNAAGTGPAATVTGRPATVPTAIRDVSATVRAGSVRLTWRAPASNGGSPLTGYLVSYRIGTGTWTHRTVTATAFSVLLPRRRLVQFTIGASNAAGTGRAATVTRSTR
jgi:hypothetical protein